MRIHSIEKIKELKRLRRRGLSINELVERLSIPKTTVWHHIRAVRILPQYALILKSKQGGSAKRKEKNWEQAKKYAQDLLQSPSRDFIIILAMLYWGEGSKRGCEFINSDGRIIRSYLIILRKILKIPENTIKPTMRIFSGMDKKECLSYWSKITEIPKDKFFIRFNDGGKRGKTRYGMCRITIRRGSNTLKLIRSSIDQIFSELIEDKKRPLSLMD